MSELDEVDEGFRKDGKEGKKYPCLYAMRVLTCLATLQLALHRHQVAGG